jgi:hypothetical protein
MTGESYRFLIEILDQLSGLTQHSKQDSEKILFSRQQELNFIAQEFTKLKELYEKLNLELNKPEQTISEDKKEETKTNYIRPDQNPNTRVGKAALELQQRKKVGKPQEEEV